MTDIVKELAVYQANCFLKVYPYGDEDEFFIGTTTNHNGKMYYGQHYVVNGIQYYINCGYFLDITEKYWKICCETGRQLIGEYINKSSIKKHLEQF